MTRGYLSVGLHAHLPFVRHPEFDDFLEEAWLFEAGGECDVPIFHAVERPVDDGIPVKLAMSLTPPLTAMLDDPLLKRRLGRYVQGRVELAEREAARPGRDRAFDAALSMYRTHFRGVQAYLQERCGDDLLNAPRERGGEGQALFELVPAHHLLEAGLVDGADAGGIRCVSAQRSREVGQGRPRSGTPQRLIIRRGYCSRG